MGDPFRIRLLTPEDRPALAEIEQAVFTDPWPEEAFASLGGPYALAADHGTRLVGFILGRSAADEGEILNLAVVADLRRRGVASKLLDELLARLADNGVRQVFLEVRESNDSARRFYEHSGFEVVGRRRGYYRIPTEDALVMRQGFSGAEKPAKK